MAGWERFKKDYQGKKVLIAGLGLHGGGVGVAKLFAQIGCPITVTDLKTQKQLQSSVNKLQDLDIKFALGQHDEKDFRSHDVVIRNPGVPKSSKYLKIARQANVPIKMEVALFAKYFADKIIGVTGTRGKSTTTHMIAHILKNSGKTFTLAGNLPGQATLPFLKTSTNLAVLELSSWQLQGFDAEKISPHIAVATNIYPDHLNRYQSMRQYADDKKTITRHQTSNDYLIVNKDNTEVAEFSKDTNAHVVWFSRQDLTSDLDLKIPGQHNLENAAAALKVAEVLSIKNDQAIKALNSFTGVPYRLETIATINGVEIINDTTSTTPVATIKALKSLNKPVHLLLGGQSKNLPFEQMVKVVNNRTKSVWLLTGSGTEEVKKLIDKKLIKGEFKSQDEAVRKAIDFAKSGEIVLFSPGFTSFDMFNHEFERGDAFNQSVKHFQKK